VKRWKEGVEGMEKVGLEREEVGGERGRRRER
jgi:hypothetical protein